MPLAYVLTIIHQTVLLTGHPPSGNIMYVNGHYLAVFVNGIAISATIYP